MSKKNDGVVDGRSSCSSPSGLIYSTRFTFMIYKHKYAYFFIFFFYNGLLDVAVDTNCNAKCEVNRKVQLFFFCQFDLGKVTNIPTLCTWLSPRPLKKEDIKLLIISRFAPSFAWCDTCWLVLLKLDFETLNGPPNIRQWKRRVACRLIKGL